MPEERHHPHHPIGPSKVPAMLDCVNKPAMELLVGGGKARGGKETPAQRGHRLHNELEKIITEGSTLSDEITDKRERKLLENALLFYNTVIQGLSWKSVESNFKHPKIEWFGTVDMWGIDKGVLHVADFKTGQVQIEPTSPQLKSYAYLIMAVAEDSPTMHDSIETVKLTIIQDTITTAEFTAQEIWDWANTELLPKLDKAMELREEVLYRGLDALNNIVPLKVQSLAPCKYCKATNYCTAFQKKAKGLKDTADKSLENALESWQILKILEKNKNQLKEIILDGYEKQLTPDNIKVTLRHMGARKSKFDLTDEESLQDFAEALSVSELEQEDVLKTVLKNATELNKIKDNLADEFYHPAVRSPVINIK